MDLKMVVEGGIMKSGVTLSTTCSPSEMACVLCSLLLLGCCAELESQGRVSFKSRKLFFLSTALL